MLQHKLSLALALITAALVTFLPFAPQVSPQLAVAIVGFLGTITTTIAKFQTPPGQDQPKGSDVAKAGLVWLVAVLTLLGCASPGHLTPAAKSVVTNVDDVARRLCLLAHADALGVSVEQVAGDVCSAEQAFAPFRPYVLSAKRNGAVAAGVARESDAGAP